MLVVREEGRQLLLVSPQFSPRGGAAPVSVVSGRRDDEYQPEREGTTSASIFGSFANQKGELILAGPSGVLRFKGSTEEEKKFQRFKDRYLPGILPTGAPRAFEPIHAKSLPRFPDSSVAALNLHDDALSIWDTRGLSRLVPGADGLYAVAQSRDFENEQSAMISAGGPFVVLAMSDGNVHVCDAQTLQTISTGTIPHGEKPRVAESSADGSWSAVLTHSGSLVLFDGTTREFTTRLPPENGRISAIGFTADNQLIVSDGRRGLRFYRPATMEQTKSLNGTTGLEYRIYDWFVHPLYTVLPKPSELDQLVQYLVTGEKSVAIGEQEQDEDNGTENLQQRRITFNLWASFWSNLAFVAVMLLGGCVLLARRDF
jgi:hypothetical protein